MIAHEEHGCAGKGGTFSGAGPRHHCRPKMMTKYAICEKHPTRRQDGIPKTHADQVLLLGEERRREYWQTSAQTRCSKLDIGVIPGCQRKSAGRMTILSSHMNPGPLQSRAAAVWSPQFEVGLQLQDRDIVHWRTPVAIRVVPPAPSFCEAQGHNLSLAT